MSRQQRTIKPRRKPGLAEKPQYEAIVWSLGVPDGNDILLTPDYPIESLFLNGLPKLRAVLSDQLPIACAKDGDAFRLSYFAPLAPDERYRMAAEDNAIRNQFGGRLAAGEQFGLREFPPFEWAYYGRNDVNIISLIRTSGDAPVGAFEPPELQNMTTMEVPNAVTTAGSFIVLTYPSVVSDGDTLTLADDSLGVRDFNNGPMKAGSVLVTS